MHLRWKNVIGEVEAVECDFLHDDFGADVGEHRRAGEELEEKE